jgi:hypothetical protein
MYSKGRNPVTRNQSIRGPLVSVERPAFAGRLVDFVPQDVARQPAAILLVFDLTWRLAGLLW